ncbi:lysophospholipid acyltransferase family protein [Sphingomonas profundi]|uniref:lysophospholipid acyltransferase family protein n=1 Tax=Alterirhizorhabdus profundi TaxID=2681549 RepID=UPI001E40F178|nr:lysophospholipid acyltransferase family protein [Sphingomonas profundi]
MAAAFVGNLPGHLVARRRPAASPHIRHFLTAAGRAFGLRVTIAGTPLPRDVLFVANHVSWLDILALGGATGTAFVSKDDVAGWPLVGWMAREAGTIFIRRQRHAVRGQADELGRALAAGRAVALFPEGTTGRGDALLPFRAALLAAVADAPAGVRVQPVAIDYGAAARDIAWTNNEGTIGNVRRVGGRADRLRVTLRFLPPIDPAGMDRKAIAAAAREAIGRALSESGTIAYEAAP